MHDGSIHIDDGRVIPEDAPMPLTSYISYPAISITIIYPAIKPDMHSPISGMPSINTAGITPISRRPKQPGPGRRYPYTRYPIISVNIIVRPITRRP
jgi:hypothetical protein